MRQRGKFSLVRYMQQFTIGERVVLHMEPSVHEGTFHHNFTGRAGFVEGKQGFCYRVKINDRGKEKLLIVHPVHLQRA